MTTDDAVARATALVGAATQIAVLTGAGISTDSGIPDFRGPNGVWTRDPAAEKLADIRHYVADPEIRKRSWRMRATSGLPRAQPNAGHRALVALERRGALHTLVTQNVDGLHQLAGSDPTKVVEVHGNVREVVCLGCGWRAPVAEIEARLDAGEEDPPCLRCGGIVKVATIMFGQGLVVDDLERAERAARECDLLLAVGTSLQVQPIADMAPIAIGSGARFVIVNGEPTVFDRLADATVHAGISEVLPEICGAR